VPEFLLELGLEEMPARWLEKLGAELATTFAEVAGREFAEEFVQTAREPRALDPEIEVLQAKLQQALGRPPGPGTRRAGSTLGGCRHTGFER